MINDKRIFDIIFSTIGLMILFPIFIFIALFIKADSKGPIFFRQERVGKNFRTFRIFKFRTMLANTESNESLITATDDNRITKVGRLLRKYKLDELPQLLNIFKGEMSFVGPRPEVVKYVKLFNLQYKNLLRIRPGITDIASVSFSNEEEILLKSKNKEEDYIEKILPEKIRLSSHYVEHHNFLFDLKIIVKTIHKAIKG